MKVNYKLYKYNYIKIAGKCLGDVVSKLGDSVLQDIIPLLEKQEVKDSKKRIGMCLGLKEIIQACPRNVLRDYAINIIKPIEEALGDEEEEVRNVAAEAFGQLYKAIGNDCLRALLSRIMDNINSGNEELQKKYFFKYIFRATNSLKSILSKQLNAWDLIYESLLVKPLNKANIDTLSQIVDSCGSILHFATQRIFNDFLNVLHGLPSDLVPTECV